MPGSKRGVAQQKWHKVISHLSAYLRRPDSNRTAVPWLVVNQERRQDPNVRSGLWKESFQEVADDRGLGIESPNLDGRTAGSCGWPSAARLDAQERRSSLRCRGAPIARLRQPRNADAVEHRPLDGHRANRVSPCRRRALRRVVMHTLVGDVGRTHRRRTLLVEGASRPDGVRTGRAQPLRLRQRDAVRAARHGERRRRGRRLGGYVVPDDYAPSDWPMTPMPDRVERELTVTIGLPAPRSVPGSGETSSQAGTATATRSGWLRRLFGRGSESDRR